MTTVTIPTLETERLTLRAFVSEDLPRCAQYWADPASRFTGGPKDEAESWHNMAREMGHWVLRGFGQWAVAEKSTNVLVGVTGGFFPSDWPEKEIGWFLVPDSRGNGYATEAAGRVRQWLYEKNGWTTAVSYIGPENEPSKRVAERLGATLETEIELKGQRCCVYRHPSPEMLAALCEEARQ